MALDAQPVADPAGADAVKSAILGMVFLALAPAMALELDVPTEEYREAAETGAVGTIAGRALADPKRPGEKPASLPDVSVTLVPRSGAFLVELDRIREQARRDPEAFRSSARAVAQARHDLERALWQAGAAELVRSTPVEPDGAFVLERVPAGAWLLMAQRAVFVPKASATPPKRDRDAFGPRAPMTGYYAVTIWLRPLSVRRGESASVELTDRNAWMRAIAEERDPTGGR
jgi:hypothetical protein